MSRAIFERKLENDPAGRMLLFGLETGIEMQPSMSERVRLHREFGLYTLSWEHPFDMVLSDDAVRDNDVVGIHMLRADSLCSEPRRNFGGPISGGSLLTKLPRPTFTGRQEDWNFRKSGVSGNPCKGKCTQI